MTDTISQLLTTIDSSDEAAHYGGTWVLVMTRDWKAILSLAAKVREEAQPTPSSPCRVCGGFGTVDDCVYDVQNGNPPQKPCPACRGKP